MKSLVVCLKLESYPFLTAGIPSKFAHASQLSLQRSLDRSEIKKPVNTCSCCIAEPISAVYGQVQLSHVQPLANKGLIQGLSSQPTWSCPKCNSTNTVDVDHESKRITKRCFPDIRNTTCTLDSSKFVNSWPKSHLTCNYSFSKYYHVKHFTGGGRDGC